eukprot:3344682-Rhodomonas_salina.1
MTDVQTPVRNEGDWLPSHSVTADSPASSRMQASSEVSLSENASAEQSTPLTQRKRLRGAVLSTCEETASLLERPCRAATLAGQERAAAVEDKYHVCESAEKEARVTTTIR